MIVSRRTKQARARIVTQGHGAFLPGAPGTIGASRMTGPAPLTFSSMRCPRPRCASRAHARQSVLARSPRGGVLPPSSATHRASGGRDFPSTPRAFPGTPHRCSSPRPPGSRNGGARQGRRATARRAPAEGLGGGHRTRDCHRPVVSGAGSPAGGEPPRARYTSCGRTMRTSASRTSARMPADRPAVGPRASAESPRRSPRTTP